MESKINLKYYIGLNNEKTGPFTSTELLNMNISNTTLVWREGFEKWVMIKELDELSDLYDKLPPPLPEVKKQNDSKPNSSKKTIAISILSQVNYITWSFLLASFIFVFNFFLIENYFKYSVPIDENELKYEYTSYENLPSYLGSGSTEYSWGKYSPLLIYSPQNINSKLDMVYEIENKIIERKENVLINSIRLYFVGSLLIYLIINVFIFVKNITRWTTEHSK
jgi:hypothetical protein